MTDTGIVICMDRVLSDLHIVQLMPMPTHPSSLASLKSRMFYLVGTGIWKRHYCKTSVFYILKCSLTNMHKLHIHFNMTCIIMASQAVLVLRIIHNRRPHRGGWSFVKYGHRKGVIQLHWTSKTLPLYSTLCTR